jgi:hypothetical protein
VLGRMLPDDHASSLVTSPLGPVGEPLTA